MILCKRQKYQKGKFIMEKKFKRNIVKTGIFVCGALLLLCFLTFVALGVDIFAQSSGYSTLMTVTGAFAFSLVGLTLITLILLIIQNASKRFAANKGLSIAIFVLALFSTIASLAMLIVTLVLSNSESGSSAEALLGALVGTSAQSGYIATIVIFGVLAYLECWSAFIRENEEIELAYDDMIENAKVNTILNNTSQNLSETNNSNLAQNQNTQNITQNNMEKTSFSTQNNTNTFNQQQFNATTNQQQYAPQNAYIKTNTPNTTYPINNNNLYDPNANYNMTNFEAFSAAYKSKLYGERAPKKPLTKSQKIKVIFYSIIFSCVFLFAVFISLFIAFIADEGNYKSAYPISKLDDGSLISSYYTITIYNDEGGKAETFKLAYIMDDVYTEQTITTTISNGYNTIQFNLATSSRNFDYVNLYYENDNGDYIALPFYAEVPYAFGTVEIVFLTLSCVMVAIVVAGSIAYVMLSKREKLREQNALNDSENINTQNANEQPEQSSNAQNATPNNQQ